MQFLFQKLQQFRVEQDPAHTSIGIVCPHGIDLFRCFKGIKHRLLHFRQVGQAVVEILPVVFHVIHGKVFNDVPDENFACLKGADNLSCHQLHLQYLRILLHIDMLPVRCHCRIALQSLCVGDRITQVAGAAFDFQTPYPKAVHNGGISVGNQPAVSRDRSHIRFCCQEFLITWILRVRHPKLRVQNSRVRFRGGGSRCGSRCSSGSCGWSRGSLGSRCSSSFGGRVSRLLTAGQEEDCKKDNKQLFHFEISPFLLFSHSKKQLSIICI